jgi:hypothetical protein
MESELENGTRATFISRHITPVFVRFGTGYCAPPMPVTTPPGPKAYSLSSSIPAGDTYQAFSWPENSRRHHSINSPTVNDESHAAMSGVRDSGWGRTGPD